MGDRYCEKMNSRKDISLQIYHEGSFLHPINLNQIIPLSFRSPRFPELEPDGRRQARSSLSVPGLLHRPQGLALGQSPAVLGTGLSPRPARRRIVRSPPLYWIKSWPVEDDRSPPPPPPPPPPRKKKRKKRKKERKLEGKKMGEGVVTVISKKRSL